MIGCEAINLQVDILLAPEGNSSQPVFLFERSLSDGPIVAGEYASRGRKLRAGDFASNAQAAIRTWGLFRMRLYFPESLRVLTYSLSSSSPNHTGVGTAAPVLRKVERLMYF
jgi:hypothetical protein